MKKISNFLKQSASARGKIEKTIQAIKKWESTDIEKYKSSLEEMYNKKMEDLKIYKLKIDEWNLLQKEAKKAIKMGEVANKIISKYYQKQQVNARFYGPPNNSSIMLFLEISIDKGETESTTYKSLEKELKSAGFNQSPNDKTTFSGTGFTEMKYIK